ncbi:hypothetical protein EYF80_020797 [Liparis tanakae]|uniref:Uncharacterized protein n=1 Tax=Liparis tanakae TaxID=230148 RepID=A0A4Z2HSV0_9TELE|nr:hypothetical protein EYF80_020797 [Liparis tanakae]
MHIVSARDEYFWKLVADFIGPQSGEGLELEKAPCKNRLLIQVGLMREDNNFPWIDVLNWLTRIFPGHHSADFRRLIESGIATTSSLGSDARLAFLESYVNFNFVGPICDSIGVERQHLLEMRDFSSQAQWVEVTNGLILELSDFVTRERIAPVVLVTWLRNFNSEFCEDGDIKKAYKVLRSKIKKLKLHYRNSETRSRRRNAAMEHLRQSPFELVQKKSPKLIVKKRMKREETIEYEKVTVKEEYESDEITRDDDFDVNGVRVRKVIVKDEEDGDDSGESDSEEEETSGEKQESLNLLDIAMVSVQKLSRMYGVKNETCGQVCLDLLKNQYALTCKEHPAMAEFEKKLDAVCEEVSLAYPVVFLHRNANFLVEMHDAVERQIVSFEKEIVLSTGEELGRDKLPKFRDFVNLSESATSRYIHMACDVVSPAGAPAAQDYRKHWVAFCEEKKNPSRLSANQSNKFTGYFESAAALVHHHREMAPFLSDLLSMNNDECPNVILECVAADAADPAVQSLVCVLAVVYCKVLGPYWQLLRSGAEYSRFGHYMLSLYQKFLDWSKDPSTLLEPEGAADVFQQFPSQEKTFDGVFQFCGQWHTNRDLIRACLKKTVKVIATATEEHLKDFLPGGMFSTVPSPELSLRLAGCTFSVLMAEYPLSRPQPDDKKKISKRPSRKNPGSSQEDGGRSGSSAGSSDDSCARQAKHGAQIDRRDESSPPMKKSVKKEKEPEEENMDMDYIMATVNENGGPCKSQQEVDKMMLRFDGKTRAEKREAVRCELLYQKMVLNNTDPNLDCVFSNVTKMVIKLKVSLPRVKPGYSLVWAPRKMKMKPALQDMPDAAVSESGGT